MMTEDEFWQLIEAAREGAEDTYEVAERLGAALGELPPERIVAFVAQQNAQMARSYTWALWGAGYLINGGCSDDGFEYFRGWLLAQGRQVFEAALTDPDTLADGDAEHDEAECEDMISVANWTYNQLTGAYPEGLVVRYPDKGEGWDFDDSGEMKRRYPRIWARFCADWK